MMEVIKEELSWLGDFAAAFTEGEVCDLEKLEQLIPYVQIPNWPSSLVVGVVYRPRPCKVFTYYQGFLGIRDLIDRDLVSEVGFGICEDGRLEVRIVFKNLSKDYYLSNQKGMPISRLNALYLFHQYKDIVIPGLKRKAEVRLKNTILNQNKALRTLDDVVPAIASDVKQLQEVLD